LHPGIIGFAAQFDVEFAEIIEACDNLLFSPQDILY